jgi:predicted HicB family RNase H-like nuclease
MATVSNFALRLPPSLLEDVKALAARDAVSVNQFLVQAAAEKGVVQRQFRRRVGDD